MGNSYRLLLPAGTTLTLPNDASAQQIRAVAADELDLARSGERTLVLAAPLQLVSPAYIAQRDAAEFAALQALIDAKAENARLRDK